MNETKKSLLINGFAAATMATVAGLSISHGLFYMAGLTGLTAVFEAYVAKQSISYNKAMDESKQQRLASIQNQQPT